MRMLRNKSLSWETQKGPPIHSNLLLTCCLYFNQKIMHQPNHEHPKWRFKRWHPRTKLLCTCNTVHDSNDTKLIHLTYPTASRRPPELIYLEPYSNLYLVRCWMCLEDLSFPVAPWPPWPHVELVFCPNFNENVQFLKPGWSMDSYTPLCIRMYAQWVDLR